MTDERVIPAGMKRQTIRIPGRELEVDLAEDRPPLRDGRRIVPEVEEVDQIRQMMDQAVTEFGPAALDRDTPLYRDGVLVGIVRYRVPQ